MSCQNVGCLRFDYGPLTNFLDLMIFVVQHGVSNNLQTMGPVPVGADLAAELFRWDQRVFATVLR